MSQFIEMFGDTHMRSDHSRQWKEVVEIINGKDYKSIQVEDGGYPVYGTGGEMARASDYLSPANSILLGRKGTIDKPLLIREKYWNVDTAFGAVPDEKVLHYVYFYWHCKTIDFNVLNKGTTLPSTTKVDLLNLWIKIPSMEEQTRFGSIVEQADKSEFVGCKSQFIEMFGDTHMRSDHSRQWKEVVEIINGKDYKSIQVEDGGYPVYGTGGEMARASDYLSPANSILLGRKGTIDKPLLIREKYWNVDTAFGAVPDEKVLHYVYFYWHCKTIDFNVLNKGTTLPSTTKVDLLNLWIKIPSMEEQTRFGSIVEQADKSEYYN